MTCKDRRYPSDSIKIQEKMIPIRPKCAVDVYRDFAHAIRTGCAPFVRPEETLQVMEVIDRCRREAGTIK